MNRKKGKRKTGIKGKLRKIMESMKKESRNTNIPQLPIEMIIKVITKLDNIEDIRTCMLLSKEVNNYMFRTPEIMKRLKFNFYCIDESDKCKEEKFITSDKSKYIRNMAITYNDEDYGFEYLRDFLSQTPNLVEFSFRNKLPFVLPWFPGIRFGPNFFAQQREHFLKSIPSEEEDMEDFRRYWTPASDDDSDEELILHKDLKVLEIQLEDLDDFLCITNQISSLVKLTVFISTWQKKQRIMTEFILKQDNLKELSIEYDKRALDVEFPTREVTNDVKFKLKSLKIITSGSTVKSDYFEGFLMTQADSLEELKVNFSINDSIFDIIFNNFTKLKKLTQNADKHSILVRDENVVQKTLKSLTYYCNNGNTRLTLHKIINFFPNLDTINCRRFMDSIGDFKSIRNIQLGICDAFNLKNAEFENLEKFEIENVAEFMMEKHWHQFVKSIENVKELTIGSVEKLECIPLVLKSLKEFKRIEKFNFRNNPRIINTNVLDDNEEIPDGVEFYKILVDKKQKTVKISNYIVQNRKDLLEILVDNFKDFEIFEFCFSQMEILMIKN